MDIRHLRYFVAVAEEGHMTRAAGRLGIQQPPLSRQIRELEERVGTPLFLRHPKGVEPTRAGSLFLAEARRVLEAMDAMEDRLVRIARGELGSLAIGFTSSAAAHAFTPEVLRECRSRFPEIALAISENNASELTEAVAEKRLDCAFLRVPVSRPTGVRMETLLTEPAIVALPLHHPLAVRASDDTPFRLKDFDGQDTILARRPGAPGLYGNLLALCARHRVQPRIVAEVDRMMTNLNLVAAGIGITVVPASMRGAHAHAIRYRPLASPAPLDAPLTLAYRDDDLAGPLGTFVALAREIAARQPDAAEGRALNRAARARSTPRPTRRPPPRR